MKHFLRTWTATAILLAAGAAWTAAVAIAQAMTP